MARSHTSAATGDAPRGRHSVTNRRSGIALGLSGCATLIAALVGSGTATAAPTYAEPPPGCSQEGETVICAFDFTGAAQTFTPPNGVTALTVAGSGGEGGTGQAGQFAAAPGGAGAEVTGDLTVVPELPLTLYVGGQGPDRAPGERVFGYGVGGSGGRDTRQPDVRGGGGGGGGASAIVSELGPLLVAGAGGGGGATNYSVSGNGGDSGAEGMTSPRESGPNGGKPGDRPTPDGGDGEDLPDPQLGFSVGIGGFGGGGGGGGLRGGGGGDGGSQYRGGGAGGGGGTSLAPLGGTITEGAHTGGGQIRITYTALPAPGLPSSEPGTPPIDEGPEGGQPSDHKQPGREPDHAGDHEPVVEPSSPGDAGHPNGGQADEAQPDDRAWPDHHAPGQGSHPGDAGEDSAPPSTTGPDEAPELSQCTLTTTTGSREAGAGSVYEELVFTNVSLSLCVLNGYPSAQFVSRDGISTVGDQATPESTPPAQVVVAPGDTARATLRVSQTDNFVEERCRPLPVSGIRITPPGHGGSTVIRSPVATACSTGSQMSVSAVKPES